MYITFKLYVSFGEGNVDGILFCDRCRDFSYVGFGLSLHVKREKELRGNEYIVMLMSRYL